MWCVMWEGGGEDVRVDVCGVYVRGGGEEGRVGCCVVRVYGVLCGYGVGVWCVCVSVCVSYEGAKPPTGSFMA